jgi:SAM-dependent methyltransferase
MASRSIVEETDAARLCGLWADVADGWAERADAIDERVAHVTERMLASTDPRPGERVLDLACGPGGAGLAAAEHVGAEGRVVLSDAVPEMTRIAAARAEARGLDNVETRVLDLLQVDEPDGAYDVVLCREGLMLVPDHAQAASEIHRVLRPGGRAAVVCWGPRERNPWLGLVFDAASEELGRPIPPPGVPGPFGLDDPARLGRVLSHAGLVDVTVSELPVPMRWDSVDAWWAWTYALAGPLTKILEGLPEATRKRIRGRLYDAAGPYESPNGVDLPGVTLAASGRRA